MRSQVTFGVNNILLFAILLFFVNIAFSINTTEEETAQDEIITSTIPPVKIVKTSGCNLIIDSQKDANNILLKTDLKSSNWFSGVFYYIDTENVTNFVLNMGMTDRNVQDNVVKWDGLFPVYSYTPYNSYDTYIYYTKNDDGVWLSSDPFLSVEERYAGKEKAPKQYALSDRLAVEFLSEDGKYWSAWKDIHKTEISVGNNFHIEQKFNYFDVSLAMKYPYPYNYEQEYMTKLSEANIPGVTVHNIGRSNSDKHNLYIVEVNDPTATAEELKERRVVLMYANEDGNEPDSSWVVNGAINFLVSGSDEAKKILKEVTFLFIPLFDPIGWEESTYGALTYDFANIALKDVNRTEVLSYIGFINDWVDNRKMRLDLIMNLHNIECNEGPNIMSPFIDTENATDIFAFNKFFMPKLKDVDTSYAIWIEGYSTARFMGWCSKNFGSIPVLYEINSRHPKNRLSLKDLNDLGISFVETLREYFMSEEYEKALLKIDYVRTKLNR